MEELPNSDPTMPIDERYTLPVSETSSDVMEPVDIDLDDPARLSGEIQPTDIEPESESGDMDRVVYAPIARFGGCWDGVVGSEVDCVEECADPAQSFYSGSEIGNRCAPGDVAADRCGGTGACAVGGCPAGTIAEPSDACDLIEDSSAGVATLYGACQGTEENEFHGCFWSQQDCHPLEERWVVAEDLVKFLVGGDATINSKTFCDCSDVRVGACRSSENDRTVCAVDEKQCTGPGEYFIPARQFVDHPDAFDNIDCRLCPTDSVEEIQLATRSFAATVGRREGGNQTAPNSKNDQAHMALAIVFGVTALLAWLFIVAFFVNRHFKRQRIETEEVPSEKAGFSDELFEEEATGAPSIQIVNTENLPAKNKTIV